MSRNNTQGGHELLRSYAFGSTSSMPRGMHSASMVGPNWHYSGYEAAGRTHESVVVLCRDERRFWSSMRTGRTALLHIVTPNNRNAVKQVSEAVCFTVDSLLIDSRTPQGLVAVHDTYIPQGSTTRSRAILSHVASMSGEPTCPESLRSPVDLVDLDWREATTEDFGKFADTLTQMITESESRIY